jgi:preprotein translocase subunit SecY
MFETLRQLFKPNNKDIRARVRFTLVALFVFIVGTNLRVPGTDPERLLNSSGGILDLMDVMGGGALRNFSILALGVMPYITASIVVQLLQMDVVPTLTEWSKQGEVGRRKLNRLTRYVGLALAFAQGYAFALTFDRAYGIVVDGNAFTYVAIATMLTAGTAFLLWLGDQITAKGIGNGISLIIMAGIVSRLPQMFIDAFQAMFDKTSTQTMFLGSLSFVLFVLIYLFIIVGVIFVQQAVRKVPIQYANRTHSAYGNQQSFIPIKINSAGVIPVIFASSILTAPITIASFFETGEASVWINRIFSYSEPIGFFLYVSLIIAFAFMYTLMQINPDDVSENLQKSGAYIPGVRPGAETATYIRRVLIRLTFVGSLFLAFIAGLPIAFTNLSSLPASVQIGGTGLLIVIGVALESFKQLEGQLVSRTYDGYMKK